MTISKTVSAGLCTGCGVCAGVCPKACIDWERREGMYLPRIEKETCVDCGLCAKVCPGLGHPYENLGDSVHSVTGRYIACYNAWSQDNDIRHISASGGVITTMVHRLLEEGIYDSVFCLDSYDYQQQLRVRRHTTEDFLTEKPSTPKSRYLPVSHEEAVRYLLTHRDERIIFIATSCALRGLTTVIEQKKLRRDNYLLLGLFCDKIFNYNVIDYWQDRYCGGSPIRALHFKNKESGGWPGDMKFFPESGESFYRPLRERGEVKVYFMPERCLYCVDKLNAMADISLGDNYTQTASSTLGSNSVILRTERGMNAWKATTDVLETVSVDIAEIQKAQYLEGRLNNLYFSTLKGAMTGLELNSDIPREQNATEFTHAWQQALKRLRSGACYHRNPSVLQKQMHRDCKKPNPVYRFLRRCLSYVKRKLWDYT